MRFYFRVSSTNHRSRGDATIKFLFFLTPSGRLRNRIYAPRSTKALSWMKLASESITIGSSSCDVTNRMARSFFFWRRAKTNFSLVLANVFSHAGRPVLGMFYDREIKSPVGQALPAASEHSKWNRKWITREMPTGVWKKVWPRRQATVTGWRVLNSNFGLVRRDLINLTVIDGNQRTEFSKRNPIQLEWEQKRDQTELNLFNVDGPPVEL